MLGTGRRDSLFSDIVLCAVLGMTWSHRGDETRRLKCKMPTLIERFQHPSHNCSDSIRGQSNHSVQHGAAQGLPKRVARVEHLTVRTDT